MSVSLSAKLPVAWCSGIRAVSPPQSSPIRGGDGFGQPLISQGLQEGSEYLVCWELSEQCSENSG